MSLLPRGSDGGLTLTQHAHSRLVCLFLLFALALVVRGLTAYFIHEHLSDPGWFQSGSYAHYDRPAQNYLDRKASVFWIDDPLRTEMAMYPPGYPLWIALIYKLSGERSVAAVQRVQWPLDSLSVLLVAGIALTAFDWKTALLAGVMAALSPLLALYGATPTPDAPTSWLVLIGVWLLFLAVKRNSVLLALTAGVMAGASCWLRANALLLPVFWAMALLFFHGTWRERFLLSGAVVLATALTLTPLLVRNAIAFRVFTPTGLGVGTNLWEGIGETDRAAEFGAVYGDQALVEQERAARGLTPDAPFALYYPDGPRRDRERATRALAVIRAHPIWYAGVMLRRMASVLKFAGAPAGYVGSAGINVTSKKSLPTSLQGGVVGLMVSVLGMLQSVVRYLALPLMLVGISLALRRDWRHALLLLSTVFYYLIAGSALHTEIRYGLAMQALLFVFAGVGVKALADRSTWRKLARA